MSDGRYARRVPVLPSAPAPPTQHNGRIEMARIIARPWLPNHRPDPIRSNRPGPDHAADAAVSDPELWWYGSVPAPLITTLPAEETQMVILLDQLTSLTVASSVSIVAEPKGLVIIALLIRQAALGLVSLLLSCAMAIR